MLASSLPANPSLEQLRKQAKDLRSHVRSGNAKFTQLAREVHPRLAGVSEADAAAGLARFSLADAQLVIARMQGFASWRRLREHVDVLTRYSRSPHRQPAGGAGGVVEEFLRLACLTYRPAWRVNAGDSADDVRRHAHARDLLAAHPQLASATIFTAAAVGDVAATRAMLAAEASLANREGGPHGWPPLLYAAFSRVNSTRPGHSTLEVARLLLAHGADPNAGYLCDGEPPPVTALSGAFRGRLDPVNQTAHQYRLPLARLLLGAGADPNDPQALDNAGHWPHDDTHLPLLFSHGLGRGSGGPWRARLGHRQPAPAQLVQDELRYAARMNLTSRVRLLLRHCAEIGIDINTADTGPEPRRTAHDLAVLAGNTEIADLLAAAGARARPLDTVDELVAACLRAERPAVQRLLTGDPGLVEQAIATVWPPPMHQAAVLDRPDAVRLLAEVGVPVNDTTLSPLHTAAAAGHLDVVQLLVELGADPTAITHDDDIPGQFTPPDDTPLGWARYNQQHEVVAYLTGLPPPRPAPPADPGTPT
jgi:ankyrin repeat protein